MLHPKQLNRSTRPRSAAGFTLLELMLALAVTAIMIVIIGMTFMTQNRMYRRQHDLGRTQQNLRLAMEIVTKDIALGGYGAGAAGEFYGALGDEGSEDNPLSGLVPANNELNDGQPNSGRDAIFLAYANPNQFQWGKVDRDQEASGQGSKYQCASAAQLSFTAATNGAAGLFNPSAEMWKYIACFSNSANTGLGVSYLWRVAANGGAGTVPVTTNSFADYTQKCPDGQALPKELTCSRLVRVAYYIDLDDTDGFGPGSVDHPYLMLSLDETLADGDDIPIAGGIEDLQFGYCRRVENCDSINWHGREDIPDTIELADISRVRVRMTAKSERPEEYGLPASAPVALDPTTYVPSGGVDYYHRRVAHQVVTLRNARAAKQIRDNY